MNYKDDLRKELDDIAPGFPAPPVYKVPEGYFEQTPDHILSRWKKTQQPSIYAMPVLRRMMAAAAVVGAIAIGIVWMSPQDGGAYMVQSIHHEDAYQYIIENMEEFEYLMLEGTDVADELPVDVQETEAIEEYLLDEMESEDIESLF